MKLATSAHSSFLLLLLLSDRPLSGECGIVDKSSWQSGESNHFPPDVGVWEETKWEVKEGGGGTGENPAAATTSSTPLHEVIYSSSSSSLRLPIPPPPLSAAGPPPPHPSPPLPSLHHYHSPASFLSSTLSVSLCIPGGSRGSLCLLLR